MFLAIDVESSDLLKRTLPLDDAAQPWPVSLAAILCDDDGTEQDFFHTRIRSDGRMIRPGAQAVHGIGSSAAGRHGVSEVAALGMLVGFAAQATRLIGHAIEFDRDVIIATLRRLDKDDRMLVRPGLELVDTMKAAAPVCRIPSGRDDGQFKWPTLDEACATVLGEAPRTGPHNAYDDALRARRLYLALVARNVLEAA